MKNVLILLAGGQGKRFVNANNKVPKQFIKIGKSNLIEYFLENLDDQLFDSIQIVAKKLTHPIKIIGIVKTGEVLKIKITECSGENCQKNHITEISRHFVPFPRV